MKSNVPNNYICPICVAVDGNENIKTLIRKTDIVYRDLSVMVFVASYFVENAEGHLIVVPTTHFENFYDIPKDVASKLFLIAQDFAIKMKAKYRCDGINILQNNEPAAGQHAFHYHMHIFPRYEGKDLWSNMNSKRETTQEERLKFAELFK